MIEAKLNFKQHMEYSRDKASAASMILTEMLLTVEALQYYKLLIAREVGSILLYAAPI